MGNLHTLIRTTLKKNKYLFLLIATIFMCAPSVISFEWLALKPTTQTSIFFSDFWKLILSHFTHSNWPHLFINITNLVVLKLAIKEWVIDKYIIGFILYSALVISIGLHIINKLTSYVGFSGIFYSLLIYVLLKHIKYSPKLYSLAITAIVLKVVHEQWYGASLAISQIIEAEVAIDAHALGILAGFSFWVLERLCSIKRKSE